MDKAPVLIKKTSSALVGVMILGIATLYSLTTYAEPMPMSGTQLAYFVGYHGSPKGYYDKFVYQPAYLTYPKVVRVNRVYWSRWTDTGYGCRSSCLINSYNGAVLRCQRRCNNQLIWVVSP